MSNHGTFSGNPKTEWLVNASEEDRDMRLLEDFDYTDPDGRVWPAPKDSIVNGASIPRPLWSTVGSPYTDGYTASAPPASSKVDRRASPILRFRRSESDTS